MKITYKEFLKAMKKADAVNVDGNITFPVIHNDGRIDFIWDDSDGLEYHYYADSYESYDQELDEVNCQLTIEVNRAGDFVLNGLYSDTDDEFQDGTSIVQVLMVTPYKKKAKK